MATREGPPRRLGPGRILAQLPAELPQGGEAELLAVITPDHPLWAVWDDYLPKDTTP